MQFLFDDFNSCLDQPLTLVTNGSSHPLTLISVDRLTASAAKGVPEAFSIVLRGNREPVLEQQIYLINNDTMGDMELFIVPIGPDDKGMCYEAVFS